MATDVEPQSEIWICQIPGRVSMALEDLRTGREKTITVKGKGSILRLTDMQRELVEEKIRSEALNPFRNGMLVRKQSLAEKSDQELTDDNLKDLFELSDDEFESILGTLTEINVRRLKELAVEADASYNKVGLLKDYIEEAYPIGGDTPTYREIIADPAGVH